jgi:putative aldouronate transport system substrate-binding protein
LKAKQWIASSAVICLAATSLAGCTDSASNNQAKSGDPAAVSTAGDGPLTPFPQEVAINVMREFNPNIWFAQGENLEDNVLTRFYKEKLNIKYNIKWKLERGQAKQQLDLAIASNDLPDIFEANAVQIYLMALAGQIQPLDKVYENYASDNVKKELEVNGKMNFAPTTINGKLYGIPSPEDFSLTVPLLWVRKDWYEKLGIDFKAPKSMDEVTALATAFMTKDPDGNGKDDTFGLAMDNLMDITLRGIGHSMGQHINMYTENKDKKLDYTDIQPSMKPLLKKMNEMYKSGLLDKEFPIKDTNKMNESIAAGKVGIAFGFFGIGRGALTQSKQNDPKAEWVGLPIPPNPQGGYTVGAKGATPRWLVVKEGFKYPEAAIKGQNLWHELWQGDLAEYYHGLNLKEYAKAGEDFKLYPPFWFDPPFKNLRQGEVFPKAWETKDRASIKSPETRKQYDRSIEYFEKGNKTLYTGWSNMFLFNMAFPIMKQVYGAPDKIVYDAYKGPTTDLIARSSR